MKCTRQRCQLALKTWAIAAFRPSWASEMTSLTPLRPRLSSERRKPSQNTAASDGPQPEPDDLAPPFAIHRRGDYCGDRDDPAVLAHFQIGRVEPEIRPFAFELAVEERIHPLVNVLAELRHLAFRDAGHAHRLHEVVDLARRNALDPGFLNDGDKRALGGLARFEEARKIAALAQLRDFKLQRAEQGFQLALAIAVALRRASIVERS